MCLVLALMVCADYIHNAYVEIYVFEIEFMDFKRPQHNVCCGYIVCVCVCVVRVISVKDIQCRDKRSTMHLLLSLFTQ